MSKGAARGVGFLTLTRFSEVKGRGSSITMKLWLENSFL
jgi:hypothetical protein